MKSGKFLIFFIVTTQSLYLLSSKLFPKRSASPQNAPIDFSMKRSDEEDSDVDDISEKNTGDQNIFKKKHLSVRSDLNRNVVHMSSTHLPSSGSEADHEEDASDEELDV